MGRHSSRMTKTSVCKHRNGTQDTETSVSVVVVAPEKKTNGVGVADVNVVTLTIHYRHVDWLPQ